MSSSPSVTKKEVIAAQAQWGEGIVQIGADFMEKKDYTQTAKDHINALYAYDMATVLFKPTKAAEEQFRGTKESALSAEKTFSVVIVVMVATTIATTPPPPPLSSLPA